MNQTALITGASGGIGRELAEIHAKKGGGLVLVARSAQKLADLAERLRTQYGVAVCVIVQDLTQPEAAQAVFAETERLGIRVDILINNAGFGGYGRFAERDRRREADMIRLNIAALTELSHLYLQGMVARRSGRILNVSSTASLLPGPLQAVYFATKAYVTSFSQALAEEVRGFGVTVTALSPGPLATDFVAAGGLEGVAVWKRAKSAKSAAECGYRAMERGKLLAFDDWKLRLLLEWLVPLLPRSWVLRATRKTMERRF